MKSNLLASLFKEAPIPVIATEAADWERCMNDATNIVRAKQSISQIRDAEKATGYIQYGLESVRDMLSGLNEQGGLNRTQFDLAQLAVEGHCQRLDVPTASFGIESSAFTEETPIQKVSLEELDGIISVVDGNHAALAADAHDACIDLCDTLKSAIPNAASRLYEVVDRAGKAGTGIENRAPVESPEIIHCFMNGESFPEDFALSIESYCATGKKLAGQYMRACADAIAEAKAFGTISFESAEAFKEQATAIFGKIKDPRSCLTEADYQNCLPGEGPLFVVDTAALEAHAGAFADTLGQVQHLAPQDPAEYTCADRKVPQSIPALTPDQISTLGTKLHGLALECDAAQFESDLEEFGVQLDAAIENFGTAFKNAAPEVAVAISSEALAVANYLDTMRSNTRFVPAYFLSNVVQTLSALTAYGVASSEQVAMEAQTGNEKPDTDKPVEEKPAQSGNEKGPDAAEPKNVDLDANKVTDLSGEGKEEHPEAKPDAGEPSKPQNGGAPEGTGEGSAPLPEGQAVAEKPAQSGDESGGDVPAPANIDLDANKVSDLSGEGKEDHPAEAAPAAGEPAKVQDGGAPAGAEGEKPVEEKPAQSGNEPGPDAPAPAHIELDANKVTDLSGEGKGEHPSMEAGGVKLRTGMKVKYSGGYGKIVKIFDRPTKYKGQVHHCDKTHPKYEVKSDDGKHLSLHKASALTVV